MIEKECESVEYNIYIAGDYDEIRAFMRHHVTNIKHACITINKTPYIYPGGEEVGVVISLRNSPAFEQKEEEIKKDAEAIGMYLLYRTNQKSFMVVGPKTTKMFSRKDEFE